MPESTALVRERHALRIAAAPDVVYRSLWEADFGGPITKELLGLRAIPNLVANWRKVRARRSSGSLTLKRFLGAGFVVLEELPDVELVLGLTGRFWTPTGGLRVTRGETFRAGPERGQAQAAWNFTLSSPASGVTELATETRVRVADSARTAFRLYWTFVRPFSGLLRRVMLRDIRRVAEQRVKAAG